MQHLVEDEEQQVKSGQQRVGQVNVLAHRPSLIVPPVERVGRREHGRPGVKGGRDARLGYAHRLLFHHLRRHSCHQGTVGRGAYAHMLTACCSTTCEDIRVTMGWLAGVDFFFFFFSCFVI